MPRVSRDALQRRIEGPYQEHTSPDEAVPAQPFLDWWDARMASRERKPVNELFHYGNQGEGPGRLVWSQDEICKEAGVSSKAIRRARDCGRITLAIVDRLTMTVSHGAVMADDLYPYEEYPSPLNARASRPQ